MIPKYPIYLFNPYLEYKDGIEDNIVHKKVTSTFGHIHDGYIKFSGDLHDLYLNTYRHKKKGLIRILSKGDILQRINDNLIDDQFTNIEES